MLNVYVHAALKIPIHIYDELIQVPEGKWKCGSRMSRDMKEKSGNEEKDLRIWAVAALMDEDRGVS